MQKAQQQKDKQIGPFYFEYNTDAEADVLIDKQVYDDLRELDDILGKCAASSMTGALGGRGGRSKKRR